MLRNRLENLIGFITLLIVIYFTISDSGNTFERRSLFLMSALVYCFLRYPLERSLSIEMGRGLQQISQLIDMIFILLTVVTFGYIFHQSDEILHSIGIASDGEIILGYIGTFLVLEATRRGFGKAVVILSAACLVYIFAGSHIPGFFGHPGFSFRRISTELFFTFEGIFSFPLYVILKYVYLFIIFGAILETAGGAQFFINFSKSLLGHVTGGPAKIAVVSSGFLGMISGSVIANVLTTGSITIPMMKKMGYNPNFAAGVETAASTGGQLVPPVMGAAIFIMAEITGISYFEICVRSALPALFYYLSIFCIVHFVSKRENLMGLSRSELPRVGETLKGSYYFIPIVFLVIIMAYGYSAHLAVMISIVVLVAITSFSAEFRLISTKVPLTQNKIFEVLKTTARRACPIAVAAACIGIVLGTLGLSGVTLKIQSIILKLAGYHMLLALILTMIIALIFGMGMDSITVYILLSTLLAPGIVQIGTTVLAAHLFIFYFGMMAMITPPVCLGAYVAAGIAEADPMQSGFWGWRLALAGFVLPYSFVYNPAVLLIGSPPVILLSIVTTSIGIVALAAALAGYVGFRVRFFDRGLLFVSSLLLIKVGWISDLIGAGITLYVLGKHYLPRTKKGFVKKPC